MSLPVGHALAGLICYSIAKRFNPHMGRSWQWIVLFIVLAGLPDIDYFPVWFLGFPRSTTHRTFLHSFAFAIMVGITLSWVFQRITQRQYRHLWWLFPMAISTHLVLDITGIDLIPPHGAKIFWPFQDTFVYTPLPFMKTMGYFENLGHSTWYALTQVISREILILGGVYVLLNTMFWIYDRRTARQSKG